MSVYRCVAEKLVDVYGFDWQDNLRMKEACICSVEGVIANAIHILLLILFAAISGLWREIAIYFFTFAIMRFYAGGPHAKNYLQCIMIYVCIMMLCIEYAKFIMVLDDFIVIGICLCSIVLYIKINNVFIKEMLIIQSFVLAIQSVGLFWEGRKCKEECRY